MSTIWESWAGGQDAVEFLGEVDQAIADGVYPDRRAAFVDYAKLAMSQLAYPHWGPPAPDDGLSAGKLADLLLAHALAAEAEAGRAVVSRRTGAGSRF